jgi:hypothetical protein
VFLCNKQDLRSLVFQVDKNLKPDLRSLMDDPADSMKLLLSMTEFQDSQVSY